MSGQTPEQWGAERQDEILGTLREFVAIPSVSTDPAYAADMRRGAEFLAAHMRACGLENVAVRTTAGHPVVMADWLHAPERPTILIYGHYDVQPPEPLAKWRTSPFEPTLRDGRLYGRGASDDKGPVIVALAAIAAFLQTEGRLPINIKLLIEGEEEIGSAHLDDFVAEHAMALAADFVLSADGATWRADLPTIAVASRGICALEVTVTGAEKDLHSGRHGGSVANPLQALSRLLASLHDETGAVAVSGFYDSVRLPSADERQALGDIPFDEAAYLRSVGAPEGAGEAGWTMLERNWLRPTLELNGIWGGYSGPGSKTVIPSEAHAKITCRLVPDQTPEATLDCIEQHLQRNCPPGVTLSVTREPGGAFPVAVPPDHPGLRLAMQVLEETYGQKTLLVRMGATVPIGGIFRQRLGIETVFFSFATSDEDYHAPNEFFRLERLRDGVQAWIRYLSLLGQQAG
ncbi:dipeptidase [Acidisoma sp.]|uniref:dipeptidase n=1 Tax=Acidisoma sp. TaxID=1872115 RepID=UPI003B00A5DC